MDMNHIYITADFNIGDISCCLSQYICALHAVYHRFEAISRVRHIRNPGVLLRSHMDSIETSGSSSVGW